MSRAISKIVQGVLKNDVPGMSIRRTMGIKEMRHMPPFLLVDHFKKTSSGGGFSPHPHKGHETITYVIKGEIKHRDFTGGYGVLREGDLQFMTAGKGIIHSETPRGDVVEGLQVWVDLPEALKDVEPGYRNQRASQVVLKEGVKVISGEGNPTQLATVPVEYYHYDKYSGHFKRAVKPDHNAFLYVLEGEVTVGGRKASKYDAVYFGESGEYIEGGANGSFVILTGLRLDQDVHVLGTFVETTKEKLKESLRSYKNKTGGFGGQHIEI